MVWVVGRKKGDNNQRALRSGEFKRLHRKGPDPSLSPSACTLGFLGLSFAVTTN